MTRIKKITDAFNSYILIIIFTSLHFYLNNKKASKDAFISNTILKRRKKRLQLQLA